MTDNRVDVLQPCASFCQQTVLHRQRHGSPHEDLFRARRERVIGLNNRPEDGIFLWDDTNRTRRSDRIEYIWLVFSVSRTGEQKQETDRLWFSVQHTPH